MATYSSNTTVKFKEAVTLTGSASYTVPANCYAIVSTMYGSAPYGGIYSATASISIDGIGAFYQSNGNPTAFKDCFLYGFSASNNHYVPAGKVISTYVSSGKASAYALITVFQNTP